MAERKARSPNLDGDSQREAARIIRAMEEVPTWANVISAVRRATNVEYTRQTLASHPCVKAAYLERRAGGPAAQPGRRLSARAQRQADRVSKQTNELSAAQATIDAMSARMVLWAHNAFSHAGLTEAILDRPLPPIKRHAAEAGSRRRRPGRKKRER